MTLQQLEYILAVSQFRHFAKAAEHCRVTQPTLSAMIQKLEDELDTKIFDRSQQPICPTPVGQLVIEQARIVLEQAGHIKDIIEEEKHSLSGVFKLGILPTIAPYLLPRFFPQLMKKYPKLDIRVTEMKTKDIKQALIKGEIDAGLIATLPEKDDFRQIPLFYEQFYAYIARESKLFDNKIIRTSDLSDEQLWMLDEGHCFRDQLVRFCQMKAAQASQIAYHLGSMETFMRMVKVLPSFPNLPSISSTIHRKSWCAPLPFPLLPGRSFSSPTNISYEPLYWRYSQKKYKPLYPAKCCPCGQLSALYRFRLSAHKSFQSFFLFYRQKMLYFCISKTKY